MLSYYIYKLITKLIRPFIAFYILIRISKGKEDRSIFIEKPEINIFPDTLVWTSDYTYSYNDPLSRNYFHHPAFDDYPVVGVSWKQAVAFSKWRTHILDNYLNDRG